jgi:putative transposase
MGEPPRLLEILLGWNESVIYFVTLCVKDRRHVLANEQTFEAIRATISQMLRWNVLAGVVMPDHVHFVMTPSEDRALSVADFSTGFKRLLRQSLPKQEWEWQRRCFDRLLRSDESLQDKWLYVRNNPVRAGLVERWEDWPYYIDLIDKEESYQIRSVPVGEAVGFPNRDAGKLTASPTEDRTMGEPPRLSEQRP